MESITNIKNKKTKQGGRIMGKVWEIPVTWEMCGVIQIEAPTIKEAIRKILTEEENVPLPDDSYYVDSSLVASMDDEEECRELYNNNQPDDKNNDV